MSRFNFIASDFKLPEVDLSNFKRMTIKDLKQLNPIPKSAIPLDELDENEEVIFYETEADMDGLTITLCEEPPDNLDYYIKKKYVYWMNYRFTTRCSWQILEYLQDNVVSGQEVELWSICFEEGLNRVKNKKHVALNDICIGDLMEIGDCDCCICVKG